MKQINQLKNQIADLNCDKELGWLQLRLLVLNLLNTMVPLTYERKEISHTHIKELRSLYQQYLQVPFSTISDTVLCISVKNEVLSQVHMLEEHLQLQAA